MSDQPLQIWIRNEKANVYGPLSPGSAELLIDNGVIKGRIQVSIDGNNYVFPGRLPGVRMVFPKELWGDVVVPDNGQDAAFSQVAPAPSMDAEPGTPPQSPTAPAGGPMAGPGVARPVVAGPSVRTPVAARAPVPAGQRPTAQGRHQGAVNMRVGVAGAFSPQAAAAPPPPVVEAAPSAPPPAAAPPRPAAPVVAPAALASTTIPAGGELERLSPLRLYFLAGSTDATGLLTLHLADRLLLVHFRKGNPEFVDSTHGDDSLPAFLVRQKLVSDAQLAQAEAEKGRFGGELVPALFGLGLMNPSTAFAQLAQRATAILGRALLAESGTFSWEPVELPAQKVMPLGNRWSLFVEQLRRVSGPDARRRLRQALDLPIMKSGGTLAASELRLTPQETRALGRFDGVTSVHQLAAAHPQEAEVLYRTAWMLEHCDLVSFAATTLAAPVEAEAGASDQSEAVTPPEGNELPADAVTTAAPALTAPPPAVLASPPPAVSAPPPAVLAPPAQTSSSPAAPRPPVGVAAPPPGAPRAPAPPGAPRPPPVMAPASGPSGVAPRPPPVMAPTAGPGAVAPRPPPVMAPTAGPGAVAARPPPVMAPAGGPVSSPSTVAPARVGPVISPATPQHGVRPATPAAASPAGAPTESDTKALVDLAESWKKMTHFEVLGLAKDAPAETVKPAYLKLARSYHPDTTPQGASEAYAKARADVFARITEANRVLSDPKSRQDYLAELAAGGTGEKVDISAILAAEEFFQKGCILVKARKFPEAVKMLDDAIKASPEEGEYYAWRGYARFFVNPDKKAGHAEAMKDLNVCLNKNPNVPSQYYFLGNMAKLLGDLKTAKTHFQKCTQLDPKHIDAQRELRMMK